jgi:hypothetical protein
MARTWLALALEVVLVIPVALGLGALLQVALGAPDLASATAESARQLFFFLDVGLGVWVVILIVAAGRGRVLPGVGLTLIAAVVGVVANALTVVVVSLVQGSGTMQFLTFAAQAAGGFLIAVAIVAPIVRGLFSGPVNPNPVKPPAA